MLASVRSLNRLENVARTLQHALNTVATVAPDWMRARLQAEWSDWPERYERRLDEYRLPKEESARSRMAVQIGLDGHALLDALEADPDLACLRQAPAITTLRRIWLQQYYTNSRQTQWRTEKEHGLPPSAVRITSPHDVEARYSAKRERTPRADNSTGSGVPRLAGGAPPRSGIWIQKAICGACRRRRDALARGATQ